MRFRDRRHAAEALARRLGAWRGRRPLVLGIPRGAVPMAAVLAEALDAELDVVLVRKIGMPGHEEFGIGAVDEQGEVFLPAPPETLGVGEAQLERLVARERDRIAQRRAAYTPLAGPLDLRGRVAIVVDDGAATGATMVAALDSARRRGAARVIAAVPVASVEAGALIREHADEAVILSEPELFGAVGFFYDDFDEVDDDEVMAVLSRARAPDPSPEAGAGRGGRSR